MGLRIEPQPRRPRKGVGTNHGASIVLAAVDAVGVAGDGEDPRRRVKREGESEEKLGVAAAPSTALHRDRRLAHST